MMKRMLLCVSLIGLTASNSMFAAANHNEQSLARTLLKGTALLVGGSVIVERIKNSYDDFKNDNPQPEDFKEDLKNVGATLLCALAAAVLGEAKPRLMAQLTGTGVLLGGVYLGLKQTKGGKNLRYREVIAAITAYVVGRGIFNKVGIPVVEVRI